ncbi:MAG: hypothetical protein ACRC9R_07940 [Enterovibrio sp.]
MDSEDTIQNDPSDTEVVADLESDRRSIRDVINQHLDKADETAAVEEGNRPAQTEVAAPSVEAPQQAAPAVERIPVVPPADMNKAEKEAFLNPTQANSHVLQQYMNRRAYETRSDYQRKMQEVEQLKQQNSSIYEVLKEHENDYAKNGISVADVARRSIAWDKAMQANPTETALDWLESYGVTLQDLYNGQMQQPQQAPANYLTREDAERIAEEKFKAIQSEDKKNAVAYYNERLVESFMKAKPLFRDPETASQLEAEMAPIVQGLSATGRYSSPDEILETAYNYVVAGNPTFSSLNSAMAARAVVDQKQAAVAQAKTASRSISGSAGSGNPRVQAKDLRDNLRRRFVGE